MEILEKETIRPYWDGTLWWYVYELVLKLGLMYYDVGSIKYWKPITLRAPVLGSFILVSLGLIVLLEILSHISTQNNDANGGGIAFAASVEEVSVIATFGYLYLPTAMAVCYNMLWSWVDLDVKRLEPWFQLSRSSGATAEDSLLLHYPFDFLAFVPFRAARQKYVRRISLVSPY